MEDDECDAVNNHQRQHQRRSSRNNIFGSNTLPLIDEWGEIVLNDSENDAAAVALAASIKTANEVRTTEATKHVMRTEATMHVREAESRGFQDAEVGRPAFGYEQFDDVRLDDQNNVGDGGGGGGENRKESVAATVSGQTKGLSSSLIKFFKMLYAFDRTTETTSTKRNEGKRRKHQEDTQMSFSSSSNRSSSKEVEEQIS